MLSLPNAFPGKCRGGTRPNTTYSEEYKKYLIYKALEQTQTVYNLYYYFLLYFLFNNHKKKRSPFFLHLPPPSLPPFSELIYWIRQNIIYKKIIHHMYVYV